MSKIIAIILKELRRTFTDRTLLVFMFALPLVIATIIAVTFGGVAGGDAPPVQDIPVAIVNQDAGGPNSNSGAMLVSVLTGETDSGSENAAPITCPNPAQAETAGAATSSMSMQDLLNAEQLTDPEVARAGVRDGTYAAAVIIPANFTSNLTYSADRTSLIPAQIEVYGDPERPIAAGIIRSIVEGFVAQTATGNIAIAAVLDAAVQRSGVLSLISLTGSEAFEQNVACAFMRGIAPVGVERQDASGSAPEFNLLVLIGASQAIFMAIFIANGFANGILQERRTGTLQRLMSTPTAPITILLGKLIATVVIIFTQLGILLIAFSIVGSVLAGEPQFIWGSDIPGLLLVVFAVALATAGIGSIIAALAKTPEQSSIIGSIIGMGMAVTGGAFGFRLPAPFSYVSIIHWGSDAFTQLSLEQTGYLPNVVILLVFGVVTFGIAFVLFNRWLKA
jgi:ABC-type multidrug transport system permease subunit